MKLKTKLRVLEFILFGIISNLADNLITLHFTGNEIFNVRILLIALAVVVPFAVIEELIVDHPNFWLKMSKLFKIKLKTYE